MQIHFGYNHGHKSPDYYIPIITLRANFYHVFYYMCNLILVSKISNWYLQKIGVAGKYHTSLSIFNLLNHVIIPSVI